MESFEVKSLWLSVSSPRLWMFSRSMRHLVLQNEYNTLTIFAFFSVRWCMYLPYVDTECSWTISLLWIIANWCEVKQHHSWWEFMKCSGMDKNSKVCSFDLLIVPNSCLLLMVFHIFYWSMTRLISRQLYLLKIGIKRILIKAWIRKFCLRISVFILCKVLH
jgi:hypothetical protein